MRLSRRIRRTFVSDATPILRFSGVALEGGVLVTQIAKNGRPWRTILELIRFCLQPIELHARGNGTALLDTMPWRVYDPRRS